MQAIKAGILEIADILVVNKADRPGADATVRALRAMLELDMRAGWQPPIVQTVALERQGIDTLAAKIDAHRAYLGASGDGLRRERTQLEMELINRLRETLLARLMAQVDPTLPSDLLDRLVARQIDPDSAVADLLKAAVNPVR